MLLEAVPNLSLGPDSEALGHVLDELEAARSPTWALLDVHTDSDHNRSVVTLAGAPAPLVGVLTRLADALIEHGSLEGHEGVHPRIGLLDVLPLVRLAAARESDAHRTALQMGHRLANWGVPVYLYGRAATRPEHEQLSGIRREVRFEGAAGPLAVPPDVGPARFHERAGASCVGVRDPLIAYNVLLDTQEIDLGRSIARSIRAANGGLPGVQALAFRLPSRGDRVQVSTNLTDVDACTPADVFAAVQGHAAEHGVAPVEGELVGLAPERTLPEEPERMGLAERPPSLEERLAEAGLPAEVP